MRTFFITGARECSCLVQEQRLTGTELREGDEAARSEIARRSD
ncbi:hypothetical protein [Streptomyces sp. NBC_01217]|nr:hypothetical protein OG507_12720 [Streptomyces sp. NBC_01217]